MCYLSFYSERILPSGKFYWGYFWNIIMSKTPQSLSVISHAGSTSTLLKSLGLLDSPMKFRMLSISIPDGAFCILTFKYHFSCTDGGDFS